MLGLFKRVMDVSQAHRVRRRAKIDSSPRSTVDLCLLYQRQGRMAAAREAAREGLMRFPYSTELRQIMHAAWKRSSVSVVRDLEAKINSGKGPEGHIALVKHYLEFDELDSAAEACQRMVRQHGNELASVQLGGQVLLSRFHRDHVAEDGSLGLKCLVKAVELDPACTAAHWDLCRTYYYIGAVSRAIFHLYKVLDRDAEHAEAKELQRVLVRLPLEKVGEAELLRRVEEADEATFRAPTAQGQDPREPGVRGEICQALEQLAMLSGVQVVALSHRGLEVVIEDGRRQISESAEKAHPMVNFGAAFRRTASLSTKRMGIGAFEEAEMCWGSGWMLAHSIGRSILVLRGAGNQRIPVVRAEARNFLASLTIAAWEAQDD